VCDRYIVHRHDGFTDPGTGIEAGKTTWKQKVSDQRCKNVMGRSTVNPNLHQHESPAQGER
jgi:hypothetical protein